jgi:hypothetical protein
VSVIVSDRLWRGLKSEAKLLTEVFGLPVTPEQVLQARALNGTA